MQRLVLAAASVAFLSGCASLEFHDGRRPDGVTFYDPVPNLQISLDKDCKITTSVVALPGTERSVTVTEGVFGSSNLTASFQGGVLTSFGQTSDSQADELLTVAARAASLGGFAATAVEPAPGAATPCPAIIMVPIVNGRLDPTHASVVRMSEVLGQ